MEGIIDKLGWKKAAAILVGLSILGILFSVFSFSNTEKQIQNVGVKTGVKEQGESKMSSTGTNNNLPENGSNSGRNLKTYTTQYFQISYPDKYNGVPYTNSKGVLSYIKLEDASVSRTIEVIVFDSSTSAVQLSRPFEAMKFAKGTVTAGSLSGTLYKGTIAGANAREIVALFPKNNTTIRVMTTYQGAVDQNFENEFNSIVGSLN